MIAPILGLLIAAVAGWGAWKFSERRSPVLAMICGVVAFGGLMFLSAGPMDSRPKLRTPTPAERIEIEHRLSMDAVAIEKLGKTLKASADFRSAEIAVDSIGPGRVRAVVERDWRKRSVQERLRLTKNLWESWIGIRKPTNLEETSISIMDTADHHLGEADATGVRIIEPSPEKEMNPVRVDDAPPWKTPSPENVVRDLSTGPLSMYAYQMSRDIVRKKFPVAEFDRFQDEYVEHLHGRVYEVSAFFYPEGEGSSVAYFRCRIEAMDETGVENWRIHGLRFGRTLFETSFD